MLLLLLLQLVLALVLLLLLLLLVLLMEVLQNLRTGQDRVRSRGSNKSWAREPYAHRRGR